MYSTCLFCNGSLGRNEALEGFPVGRRLAFDEARGRLWVICPHCARWNLSPLEARWEAIDEAERAFRGTRLRASTEHIGLGKLRDGTVLVRIGRPMLPEFAAWRYGSVFRKRLRQNYLLMLPSAIGSLGYLGALAVGAVGSQAFGSAFMAFSLATTLGNVASSYHRARVSRLTLRGNDGALVRLSAWDASRTEMVDRRDGEWTLRVAHRIIEPAGPLRRAFGITSRTRSDWEYAHMHGDAARRALASMLPTVNHHGAGRKEVAAAVDVVSSHRSLADAFLARPDAEGRSFMALDTLTLGRLPGPYRLALEMSLHEADERRALEGKLHELAARWREADEIAAIADSMFLPAGLDARLDALRDGPPRAADDAASSGGPVRQIERIGRPGVARSEVRGTNVAGLRAAERNVAPGSDFPDPHMMPSTDDDSTRRVGATASNPAPGGAPGAADRGHHDTSAAEPGGDSLKRHGDALADGSGSRHGESPPRVEPDDAVQERNDR